MLEIAVCEDERYQQARMEALLYDVGKKCGIPVEVDIYENGERLLNAVYKGARYDLIYLDIMMGDMNGVQVADRLRERDRTTQVVYVTGYGQYVKESMRTMPSGYLTKPVDPKEFEDTFVRISSWIGQSDEYFRFISNKTPCKVLTRDIIYFRSSLRLAEIVCKEKKYEAYMKLEKIEEDMQRSSSIFLRIHQSFLVNYKYISRLGHNTVSLYTGEELPMSQRRRAQVEQLLKRLGRLERA